MRLDLSEAIRHWGKYRPSNLAIGGDALITYRDLNLEINKLAAQIISNIGQNKQIAIISKSKIDFIIMLAAIIRTHNRFALVNPSLADIQIEKCLLASRCDAYIYNETKNIDKQIVSLLYTHEDKNSSNLNICEIYPERYFKPDDPAGVIFTSGTTGSPKGLVRTSYSFLSEAILWMIELELNQKTSFLIPRVLYNTTGFVLMYATLFAGGRVDLFDNPTTQTILQYLSVEPCSWALIVPSTIREILNMFSESESFKLNNVITMGEHISADDKILFSKRFKCNLIEVWGNSEGLGTITDTEDLKLRPKSVGRPFFTDSVEIMKDRSIAQPEVIGKVCGYSDNEFSEYINNASLTQETIVGGLIVSSDLGYEDNEGYLYILSRSDDVIMVDGLNVYPKDIEYIIRQDDRIRDCVVIGKKDSLGNSKPIAIVELKETIQVFNEAEMITKVNSQLAPHEYIYHIMEIGKIPRNDGEKVDYKRLLQVIKEK